MAIRLICCNGNLTRESISHIMSQSSVIAQMTATLYVGVSWQRVLHTVFCGFLRKPTPFDIDLRNQLKEVQNRYSPKPRPFNAWLTCATVSKIFACLLIHTKLSILYQDTRATKKTLATGKSPLLGYISRSTDLSGSTVWDRKGKCR